MNVSAPASVPDLTGLALLLAVPSVPVPTPGFAPSTFSHPGAEAVPSFQEALHRLLPAEGNPEEKPKADPKKDKTETIITGVMVAAPAPQTLPVDLSLSAVGADVIPPSPGESSPATPLATPSLPSLASSSSAWRTVMLSLPVDQVREVEPQASRIPTRTPQSPAPSTPSPVQSLPEIAVENIPEPVLSVEARIGEAAADTTNDVSHLAFVESFRPAKEAGALPRREVAPTATLARASQVPTADTASSLAEGSSPTESTPPDKPRHVAEHPAQTESRRRSEGEDAEPPRTENETPFRHEPSPEQPQNETQAVSPAHLKDSQSPEVARASQALHPQDSRAPAEAPALQAAPQTHAGEARAISFRVAGAGEQRVELKVTEQAGEVRLAVHSTDADLAGSLRENLGDLVHKLEQSGFHTDAAWHPAQAGSFDSNQQDHSPDSQSFQEDHSGQRQQQPGSGGGQRRQHHAEPERWSEEMKGSTTSEQERNLPIWLTASIR